MTGVGVDLSEAACHSNERANGGAIREGRYTVVRGDFLGARLGLCDLVISSMFLEHLPPASVDAYFEQARAHVTDAGAIVTLVPASPAHWGIEDEIAGHQKRYTRACFEDL